MRATWIVVAAVGCGGGKAEPTAEELHKQLAPIVEPKLQVIEKILKVPFPAPTGTIKLDGPLKMLIDTGDGKARGNAIYAFEADLRTLDRYQRNALRYNFNGQLVNDCFQIVRNKGLAGGDYATYSRDPMPWTDNEYMVRTQLPMCAAMRYLLVIKVDAFLGAEYIDKEKFSGGDANAQVHVFDLDAGGAHRGGVAFAAGSSDRVRSGRIDSDLQENFYKALRKAVSAQLPDTDLGP